MRSGWGNSLRQLRRQLCGDTPTPTLPRKQEREPAVVAETPNQCFNPDGLDPITESAPMLDVPKKSEKSHADGKILQSISEGVGVITFNNPDKRNAMSLDMWEGLGHALIALRDDPDIRVVILVGA